MKWPTSVAKNWEVFTSIYPEIYIFWHFFTEKLIEHEGQLMGKLMGKSSLRFGGAQRRHPNVPHLFGLVGKSGHQASLRGSVLGTRTTHCTDLHSCTRENNINVLCASRLDKCASNLFECLMPISKGITWIEETVLTHLMWKHLQKLPCPGSCNTPPAWATHVDSSSGVQRSKWVAVKTVATKYCPKNEENGYSLYFAWDFHYHLSIFHHFLWSSWTSQTLPSYVFWLGLKIKIRPKPGCG